MYDTPRKEMTATQISTGRTSRSRAAVLSARPTSPKAVLPGYYETSSKEKKAQKQLGKPVTPDEPFVLDPLLN